MSALQTTSRNSTPGAAYAGKDHRQPWVLVRGRREATESTLVPPESERQPPYAAPASMSGWWKDAVARRSVRSCPYRNGSVVATPAELRYDNDWKL